MLGKIESISHDRLVDEPTHQYYYLGVVSLNRADIPEEYRSRCAGGHACGDYCVVGRTYGSELPRRAAFELLKKNLPRTAGLTERDYPSRLPRGSRRSDALCKRTLRRDFLRRTSGAWRISYERDSSVDWRPTGCGGVQLGRETFRSAYDEARAKALASDDLALLQNYYSQRGTRFAGLANIVEFGLTLTHGSDWLSERGRSPLHDRHRRLRSVCGARSFKDKSPFRI